MSQRHIFLTGLPGIGKTSLIKKIAQRMAPYRPAGFYTEEIRVKGERQGFKLISFDGREGILSHVTINSPHRVGKYGVDIPGFELFLQKLDLLHSPSPLIIIDEIGKMESFSEHFRNLIRQLLDSDRVLLATIALRGSGFIEELKKQSDIALREVTINNRDRLADEIAPILSRALE